MRRTFTLILVLFMLGLFVPLAVFAETETTVPSGTKVPLSFVTKVDTGTAKDGDAIAFTVAADVLIDRLVVIKKGTPAHGLVTSVTPPGIFGKSAKAHIDFISTSAVDGLAVKLSPIDVTPANMQENKDRGGAVGASVAGAILLGPIGLTAGLFIHGGYVTVPPGAVAMTATVNSISVKISAESQQP